MRIERGTRMLHEYARAASAHVDHPAAWCRPRSTASWRRLRRTADVRTLQLEVGVCHRLPTQPVALRVVVPVVALVARAPLHIEVEGAMHTPSL